MVHKQLTPTGYQLGRTGSSQLGNQIEHAVTHRYVCATCAPVANARRPTGLMLHHYSALSHRPVQCASLILNVAAPCTGSITQFAAPLHKCALAGIQSSTAALTTQL